MQNERKVRFSNTVTQVKWQEIENEESEEIATIPIHSEQADASTPVEWVDYNSTLQASLESAGHIQTKFKSIAHQLGLNLFILIPYVISIFLSELALVHRQRVLVAKNIQNAPLIYFNPKMTGNGDFVENHINLIIRGQITLMFIMFTLHKHRSILFIRLVSIAGLVNFMRALLVAFTETKISTDLVLCLNKSTDIDLGDIGSRTLEGILTLGAPEGNGSQFCGNLIFSAEVVAIILPLLFFYGYFFPLKWKENIKFNIFVLVCTFLFPLVGLYFHVRFTSQGLIATVVTFLIYWFYHAVAAGKLSSDFATDIYFHSWGWVIFDLYNWEQPEYSMEPVDCAFELPVGLRKVWRRLLPMKRQPGWRYDSDTQVFYRGPIGGDVNLASQL